MQQRSFGATLKTYRKAHDLTQEALAELVGCSTDAIRKWEANRFRPSKHMAQRLADQFALPSASEQRAAFMHLARATQDTPPITDQHAVAPAAEISLPRCTTRFFGREAELAQIGALLADPACRVLTLCGPGGIGKTSLGLRAAQQHAANRRTCLLDLAEMERADLLYTALAQQLHIRLAEQQEPLEQLVTLLRDTELLLLLDNGEALPDSAPVLALLLERLPGLKILAMSRARLQMWEEQVFDLAGLAVPPSIDAAAPDALANYSALQLFLHAARRIAPSFAATPADLRAIARACQLVEGMPLAIELAATWTRVLTCEEIARHLAQPGDLLTTSWHELPARQRSLAAACDTSWRMLAPHVQALLRGLSVFHGSFAAPAAAAVADATPPALMQLVDVSLLRRDTSGRFSLHPIIRQYAETQLRAAPAHEQRVQKRYAAYYSAWLHERAPLLEEAAARGTPTDALLAELSGEIEHLRAAWQQLRASAAALDVVVQFVEDLWVVYERHGWYQEALIFLEQALDWERAQPPTNTTDTRLRAARWRRYAAQAALALGQIDASQAYLAEAAALLGLPLPTTRAGLLLTSLGRYMRHRLLGRWQPMPEADQLARAAHHEAARLHEQLGQVAYYRNAKLLAIYASLATLDHAERAGPSPELARAYATMCMMATVAGRHAQAAHYHQQARAAAEHASHSLTTAHVLQGTALHDLGLGHWEQARIALEQAAQQHQHSGDWRRWGECLASVQCIAFLQGRYADGLRGWAALEADATNTQTAVQQLWGGLGQGACLLYLGQTDAALSLLERAREMLDRLALPPAQITVNGLLALAYWRRAEHERALAHAEYALRAADAASVMVFTCLLGYASAAEVALAVAQAADQPNTRRERLRLAQHACGQLRHATRIAPFSRARVLLLDGRYHWLAGHRQQAMRAWRQSLALAERYDLPYEQACAHLELGRHAPGDERDAHVQRAGQIFGQLGATFEAGQAQAALHCGASAATTNVQRARVATS